MSAIDDIKNPLVNTNINYQKIEEILNSLAEERNQCACEYKELKNKFKSKNSDYVKEHDRLKRKATARINRIFGILRVIEEVLNLSFEYEISKIDKLPEKWLQVMAGKLFITATYGMNFKIREKND